MEYNIPSHSNIIGERSDKPQECEVSCKSNINILY